MQRCSDPRCEGGQTSVEYAMVVGVVIGIALILAAALSGNVFESFWTTVTDALL
jgi:Flp pilus assembly pilin Flp